jgi:hypothetical protein
VWFAGSGPKSGSGSVCSAACAPVITACTPSSAAAAAVSIETIRACACGLRSTAACSIPGRTRSAM